MTKEKIEVEKSSGNIFQDLEFPNPEEYRTKARLSLIINSILTQSGLTRDAAAKLLELSEPEITALLDGRLDDFSIESLFLLIRKLDCEVKIVVNGTPAYNPAAEINISIPF
ncbi:transcriptional regulator [Candidatus Poribacteria bacterium]|nr:MAG: transcriptional regulator [Candidatus Poribacteria bacterium]